MFSEIPLRNVLKERSEKVNSDDPVLDKIPFIKKISFNEGEIEFRKNHKTNTQMILIFPGDLVISGINAAKGAVAVYDKTNKYPAAATIHYSSYIIKENELNVDYLWYLLRSDYFRNELKKQLPGGIKSEVSSKQLLQIKIPLPEFSKQNEIVTRIKEVSELLLSAKKNIFKIQNFLETIFFEFVDSIRINLERDFKCFELRELVDKERGISYGVVQLGRDVESGVPTLRAGNLKKFFIEESNIKTIDPKIDSRYLRTKLQGGELLLKIRGGYGDLAVVPKYMADYNVSREIAVIPFIDQIIPEYAMYILSSRYNQNYMQTKLRGTSYVGLNLKDVRKFILPLPTKEIQKEMIKKFDDFSNLINRYLIIHQKRELILNDLLPSILEKVFVGELW